MTRIWIPVVTLALFVLGLLALASALFGTANTAPADPFAEYAAYMPGQRTPALTGCDVWDSYPYNSVYAWCELGDGAFDHIALRGTWDEVQGVYFYPRDMQAGDLMGWMGTTDKVRGLHGQWTFTWANCTAYARGKAGRFAAKVFLIAFREMEAKKR